MELEFNAILVARNSLSPLSLIPKLLPEHRDAVRSILETSLREEDLKQSWSSAPGNVVARYLSLTGSGDAESVARLALLYAASIDRGEKASRLSNLINEHILQSPELIAHSLGEEAVSEHFRRGQPSDRSATHSSLLLYAFSFYLRCREERENGAVSRGLVLLCNLCVRACVAFRAPFAWTARVSETEEHNKKLGDFIRKEIQAPTKTEIINMLLEGL